jgi:hypothetical protein
MNKGDIMKVRLYVACKVMLILQHVVCLESLALRLRKHFRRGQTIGNL